MAQLHLYSSDHRILMHSPDRAPRVGYVLKFENTARDQGFPTPINTQNGRSAPGHCAQDAGVKRPTSAPAWPAQHAPFQTMPRPPTSREVLDPVSDRCDSSLRSLKPGHLGATNFPTFHRAPAQSWGRGHSSAQPPACFSRLSLPGDGKSGRALPRVTCRVLFFPPQGSEVGQKGSACVWRSAADCAVTWGPLAIS